MACPPRPARALLLASVLVIAAAGALVPRGAAAEAAPGSISLVPAVITLDGTSGQASTHALSLTNHTDRALAFEMMALDVITRDGVRTFVPAGELPGSIAATAIFSAPTVTVPPLSTASVEVTLTFPPGTAVRAVAAGFRGLTHVTRADGVQMTGSLACLITFSAAAGTAELSGSPLGVTPPSDTANFTLTQDLRNVGTEPVMPRGAVALLDAGGRLVGRLGVEPQRLLPGERLPFVTQFPGRLAPGRYRAVASYEYAGRVLTTSHEFTIHASLNDGRLAADAGAARPR